MCPLCCFKLILSDGGGPVTPVEMDWNTLDAYYSLNSSCFMLQWLINTSGMCFSALQAGGWSDFSLSHLPFATVVDLSLHCVTVNRQGSSSSLCCLSKCTHSRRWQFCLHARPLGAHCCLAHGTSFTPCSAYVVCFTKHPACSYWLIR